MSIRAVAMGKLDTASVTSEDVPCAAGAAIGDLLVVSWAQAFDHTLGTSRSVTDSQGNVYQEYSAYAESAFRKNSVWFSVLTTALTTSDHVTVSVGVSGEIGAMVTKFVSPTGWLPTASVQDQANYRDNVTASTALSGSATGTLAQSDELVYVHCAINSATGMTVTAGNPTGSALNPNLAAGTSSAFSAGQTAMTGQWAETSATSAVTATMTSNQSAGYEFATVTFMVASAPTFNQPHLPLMTPQGM